MSKRPRPDDNNDDGDGNEPDPKRLRIAELKPNSYLTARNHYRVLGIEGAFVAVEDSKGMKMDIGVSILEEECVSASQFVRTEVVSMTRLAELFRDIESNTVFTVRFLKKPSVEQSYETMRTYFVDTPEMLRAPLEGAARKTKTAAKKAWTAASTGDERILTGYKVEGDRDSVLGRANVIDLHHEIPGPDDGPKAFARRLVDYRTISELIVNGVHYVLKGKKPLLTESGKAY